VSKKSMNILLADDDEMSRKTLHHRLTQLGHTVWVAVDGREAWDLFETHHVALDMAILDWMMPEIDGVELCRKIRAFQGQHYHYIILLTAREQTRDVISGLQSGADDYVTKPYEFAELEARISTGLRIVTLETTLSQKVGELQRTLAQVRQLHGLLPICCYCKKVRSDHDYWQEVERYLSDHADVKFSHGICPDCMRTVVEPELARWEATRQAPEKPTP